MGVVEAESCLYTERGRKETLRTHEQVLFTLLFMQFFLAFAAYCLLATSEGDSFEDISSTSCQLVHLFRLSQILTTDRRYSRLKYPAKV